MPPKRKYRMKHCGRDENTNPCARLFKVLASDQRLRILVLLKDGEKSSGELSLELGLDPSVVSRHLSLMRSFRLIATRKEGNNLYYSIADSRVLEIRELGKQIVSDLYQWNLEKID